MYEQHCSPAYPVQDLGGPDVRVDDVNTVHDLLRVQAGLPVVHIVLRLALLGEHGRSLEHRHTSPEHNAVCFQLFFI